MLASALFLAAALGPPQAVEASKLRWMGWMACALDASSKYAELSEPAETIAVSALSQCAPFENEYRSSLTALRIDDSVRLADATKNQIISDRRSQLRGYVITNVMEIRRKKAAK